MLEATLNPLSTKPLVVKSRWRLAIEPIANLDSVLPDAVFLVRSVNLPFDSITVENHITREKKPTAYNYPESITIEIFEDKEFHTLHYFKDWMDYIFDKEKNRFRAGNNYTQFGIRTGTLSFYDDIVTINNPLTSLAGVGDLNVLKEITFHNMKCLSVSEVSLSKEDDSFLTYSVEFSVDAVSY